MTDPQDVSWEHVPYLIRVLGFPHDADDLVVAQLDPRDPVFEDVVDDFDSHAWIEQRHALDVTWAGKVAPLYGERMRLAADIYASVYPGGRHSIEELTLRANDLRRRGGLRR